AVLGETNGPAATTILRFFVPDRRHRPASRRPFAARRPHPARLGFHPDGLGLVAEPRLPDEPRLPRSCVHELARDRGRVGYWHRPRTRDRGALRGPARSDLCDHRYRHGASLLAVSAGPAAGPVHLRYQEPEHFWRAAGFVRHRRR